MSLLSVSYKECSLSVLHVLCLGYSKARANSEQMNYLL
jgi:hypothetical protein